MFDIRTQAALPSPDEIARIRLTAIIKQNPITPALCSCMLMPETYVQKLAHAWNTLSGPVKDLDAFSIAVESHPSIHGFVTLTARYRHGAVHPGVELILPPEDDDPQVDCLKFEHGDEDMSPSKQDDAFWREVWTPFYPVATILNAAPKIQPNQSCPCGSGKKFKKCCFRTSQTGDNQK